MDNGRAAQWRPLPKGQFGEWVPRHPQWQHCGALKLTQGLSISVPTRGGRGMADTEVSTLDWMGEGMVGTKTMMSGTGLVVCRVE